MTTVHAVALAGAGIISLVLGAAAVNAGRLFHIVSGVKQIPALGGIAIVLGWWVPLLTTHALSLRTMAGLGLATILLIAVGVWDSRRPLGPGLQFIFQGAIAALAILGAGIMVRYVTHPWGSGLLRLDQWSIGNLILPGFLLALVWIVLLMNAMNFLDGLDGLASTVGLAAFIVVGLVSTLPHVREPSTAFLAWSAAATLLGFLFWNLPPASLYLGTVGAWWIGFLLAILSLQGSSKIATLAVVGAVPLLDVAAVVLGRLWRGQSPFRGDRTHLHHRLLQRGFSERSILALYGGASVLLGAGAVLLQTRIKILVFLAVAAVFLFMILRSKFSISNDQ